MKTAQQFLAWMVKFPTATMAQVKEQYHQLPYAEQAKVLEAFRTANKELA